MELDSDNFCKVVHAECHSQCGEIPRGKTKTIEAMWMVPSVEQSLRWAQSKITRSLLSWLSQFFHIVVVLPHRFLTWRMPRRCSVLRINCWQAFGRSKQQGIMVNRSFIDQWPMREAPSKENCRSWQEMGLALPQAFYVGTVLEGARPIEIMKSVVEQWSLFQRWELCQVREDNMALNI